MKKFIAAIIITTSLTAYTQTTTGSAAACVNLHHALWHDIFLGVGGSKDYTLSKISSYSATEGYIAIGYERSEKKRYFGFSLLAGKCRVSENNNLQNGQSYVNNNEQMIYPFYRLGKWSTYFSIKTDYNYKITKFLGISAGLGLKTRTEDYRYSQILVGQKPAFNYQTIQNFVPTINLGANIIL